MENSTWRKVELDKELRFIKGKVPPRLFDDHEQGTLPYLTPEYLRGNSSPTAFCLEVRSIKVEDNDLILLWDGSNAGEVFRAKSGILASTMVQIIPNETIIDPNFFYYFLKNQEDKIKGQIHGSGIPHIDKHIIHELPSIIPVDLAEQRAIADILSTVDDAIEQTEALIRKYQRIKQGLMQDLLQVKESWTVMPLGNACKKGEGSIQTGPFGSQLHSSDYKNEGIPIITVEHLGDNEIIHENLPLVGEEDYSRLSKYKIITGDLVFSRVGAIDRCAYVSENENGWLFSGRLLRVRPGSLFDSRFLSYLLNHYPSRLWILNNSVGSTMKCLNTTILSELPVPIPSITEQKEISEKISSIDWLIRETVQEMEKLTRIKRGLMQDLLTGKVRVNALMKN